MDAKHRPDIMQDWKRIQEKRGELILHKFIRETLRISVYYISTSIIDYVMELCRVRSERGVDLYITFLLNAKDTALSSHCVY